MNNTDTASVKPIESSFCKITEIKALSEETFQIDLQAPDNAVIDYHSGQYLQLALDVQGDGNVESFSYSIANSIHPDKPGYLQLLIHNNSDYAAKIMTALSSLYDNNETVKVTLPMGKAYLQTALDHPHILVASGSGISKIKCILEKIITQPIDADITVYWSNKQPDDFYLLSEFETIASNNPNVTFVPLLETANAAWKGRTGFIYEVIQQDFAVLNGVSAYLCGSPNMVYGTIDQLNPIGLDEQVCFSDVFEYAPR